MATRMQLEEFFAADAVRTAPSDLMTGLEFSPEIAEYLFNIGFPESIPGIFCLTPDESPAAFDLTRGSSGGSGSSTLCLGAPSRDSDLRYGLDLEKGSVALLDTTDGEAELINGSISQFHGTVFRVGQFVKFRSSSTPEQDRLYVDLLRAHLEERDPLAFRDPPGWWPNVLSYLLHN